MKISKKRSLRACTDNEDQFARGKKKGTMTREELLALPLRELDAMVAEKVMGKTVNRNHYGEGHHAMSPRWLCVPAYSTDDNAARLVRNRIAELGLHAEFICKWVNAAFEYMQATPQQQCIAAILAVQEKERGE